MSTASIPGFAWLCFSLVAAQTTPVPDRAATEAAPLAAQTQGAPVTLDGEVLYYVRGHLGPFSAEDRAEAGMQRLRRIADDPFYSEDLISVGRDGETVQVLYRDHVVGVITPEDAAGLGATSEELASRVVQIVKSAIERYRETRRPEELLRAEILLGVATLLLVAALWSIRALHRRGIRRVATRAPSRLATQIKARIGMSPEIYATYRLLLLKFVRVLASLVVVIVFMQFAFRTIPMTRGYAMAVLDYVLAPLDVLWQGFLTHVGDLFFILVVVVLTHYVLKGLRALAREASREAIVLPGIAPEWALPIYKIVRLAVFALAIVMIYPYIPGSDSQAFKGVSLFAGALFTLAATGTTANFIGGIVLMFMRTYRVGDRIRIGDVTGDVIEANLALTRIRTVKNEVITVANSLLLNGQLVNYSTIAREQGLIVHTSVTIGYDAPWRTVHELLIRAASKTSGILTDPAPFVLQTSLNDFHVSYEINAYTRQANGLARIYGELHQHIQDTFNESGVEIMSPAYGALRDGNRSTIPASHLPDGYEPDKFSVRVERTSSDATHS